MLKSLWTWDRFGGRFDSTCRWGMWGRGRNAAQSPATSTQLTPALSCWCQSVSHESPWIHSFIIFSPYKQSCLDFQVSKIDQSLFFLDTFWILIYISLEMWEIVSYRIHFSLPKFIVKCSFSAMKMLPVTDVFAKLLVIHEINLAICLLIYFTSLILCSLWSLYICICM